MIIEDLKADLSESALNKLKEMIEDTFEKKFHGRTITGDLKADLSEAAQDKLREMIADTVEKKVQKEVKKITKKLTVRFLLTGAALAGACMLADRSDKVVGLIKKVRD